MKRMIKSILCIVIILLIGCQQTAERAPTHNKNEPIVNKMSSRDMTNNNTTIADHLANIAAKVPHVEQATALIAGPFAVVGIDVDKNLDRQTVGVVKYSVAEALHEDPYGKTAVVIADGDIGQRLKNMQTEIADGRPIQGVVDELAAIVARYMPSMPVEEDKPIESEHEDNIISDEKEKKIEDIQKEQKKE